MLALRTLGAPQRRRMRGRRGREVQEAGAEPVPTSRATLIRPTPFDSQAEAEEWLERLRGRGDEGQRAVHAALRQLNRALHHHRLAHADPYAGEVSATGALAVRAGYGSGEEVAEGRFTSAWELTVRPPATKRSMEAPEERFAALLGGREQALPAEELVLRARADLVGGRAREAALQARVALESLLASIGPDPKAGELEEDRAAVGSAANAALRGELTPELERSLADAVERMELALRRRRLKN